MTSSANFPAFTYPPSLDPLSVTLSTFLSENAHYAALLAASIVFRHSQAEQPPKILIIRRSPTDSWPLLWEVPGGSVDRGDETIMHGAARELAEESGLRARALLATVGVASAGVEGRAAAAEADAVSDRMVGPLLTWRDSGKVWAKVTFLAEVESTEEVRLQEEEHVEWRWITEREALDGRCEDGTVIDFTADSVRRTVVEAFRLKRKLDLGEVF